MTNETCNTCGGPAGSNESCAECGGWREGKAALADGLAAEQIDELRSQPAPAQCGLVSPTGLQSCQLALGHSGRCFDGAAFFEPVVLNAE